MLSAGLLGGPGIGFSQDYFASKDLKETHIQTYDRYKADQENSFLVAFHVQGLDGSKTTLLDLETKLHQTTKELDSSSHEGAERKALESKAQDIQKEIDRALQNKDLKDWWISKGAPNEQKDEAPVAAASLYGGRMALQITAVVPATMAILYLLLIVYFRITGGYKKELVLTSPAPGSEF
jgi:hypothetical protein